MEVKIKPSKNARNERGMPFKTDKSGCVVVEKTIYIARLINSGDAEIVIDKKKKEVE